MVEAGFTLRPRGRSPRPAFRSFLATAGDPSPNFGGGVGPGFACFGKDGVNRRRPPLPASPPQTAWGRGDASHRLPARERILPFPRAVYGGRGRGMGALSDGRVPVAAPAVSASSTSPRGFGGRWARDARPEGACGRLDPCPAHRTRVFLAAVLPPLRTQFVRGGAGGGAGGGAPDCAP